jgi:ABC-type Fe3+/spermidine/putrescine transport system ATPase subunit
LLDEPLSSLDAGLRESMREEIKRIVRTTGTTVVNVTHDQEEAMVISDRILLLKDGRLQQEGSPGDLYWRPETAFVARFMGPTNIIQGSLGEASDGLGTLVNDGLTLRGRVGHVAAVRGASVTLLCRTEDASVRTDRPSGDGNTIAGSVANAWFAGGRWRVRVSADAGFDVVAIADTDLGYAGKVWVSLPPERCWLLDPEETGGRTGPT